MNTALLLSGGVDSAVALHLMVEHGVRPDLFYIKIGMDGDADLSCTAEEDIELCQATARKYGLSLEVVDLQREYWDRVVSYLVQRVKRGLTPNPDVMCNKLVKFGAFEEKVGHAYDRIVTGHYGRVLDIAGKRWLGTAIDLVKDQTDFLAQIDSRTVAKLQLPLGDYMKEDVRRIAAEAHLPSACRHDSQGICFLGKIDYNAFVKRFLGEREGWIVELETGRRLGKHNGYWFHTIGQRRGLNLGGGPWYVVKKDTRRNVVYVSNGFDTEKQYSASFRLADFHFITADPWSVQGGATSLSRNEATAQGTATSLSRNAATVATTWQAPIPVCFKVRHTDRMMTGHLTRHADGIFEVASDLPVQGVAPGQFGVLYTADARICVGSGEITLK